MKSIIYYGNENAIITSFKNKKLKKIVNVYQQNTINIKPGGFGDYLRGCISLSILCKMINVEFAMNIKNHPMSKYIITDNHEDTSIDYKNIIGLSDLLSDVINYINDCKNDVCYLYTNLIFDNKMVKKTIHVTDDIKYNIIKYINPSSEVQNNIKLLLDNHKLIINNFNIIHVRCGDELINTTDILNEITNENKKYTHFFNKVFNYIKKFHVPNKTYLISDSLYVKKIISDNVNNIKYDNNNSVHLSLTKFDDNNNVDLIKYTIQDLYLLLYCKQIISITIYRHGSGFIKWMSTLFNKPYIQYILEIK
jgi:hypothetical protein